MKTVINTENYRSLDVSELSTQDLQSYLQAVIAPRPIALVSTVDSQGRVNLSPFSFFNLFSMNPPICIFSPSRRIRDNSTKHTLENIREVPECVIHLVNHDMVQQVSLSSSEYPAGVNEFEKAGFTMLASETVRPPRVAESPVQLECKVDQVTPLGYSPGAGNLVLAEIRRIYIREELLGLNGDIDPAGLDLVARLGGDWYCRIGAKNLFQVPKPLTGPGIGFDQLPEEIRQSAILTGNDLAQLANVREIPGLESANAYLQQDSQFLQQLHMLHDQPLSRLNLIHARAQQLIRCKMPEAAWLTLMSGYSYKFEVMKTP